MNILWTTSREVGHVFAIIFHTQFYIHMLDSPEFASNVYGWDFAISIFSVAVYSHRCQTVCEPFPLEFCASNGSDKISSVAVAKIVQCLEQIPPVQLMADDKRTLVHVCDWTLQVRTEHKCWRLPYWPT